MKVRHFKLIAFLLVLFIIFPAIGFGNEILEVHFLDVGQAEATLLLTSDFTMLIDAGDVGRFDVIDHLRRLGVENVDLIVITHPHSDHIGQLVEVLTIFPVYEVWMSGYEHTTPLFESVLDALLASDVIYYEPRRGQVFSYGDLILEVLNPTHISDDLHDTNIVLRVKYGDITFVFTGDAEKNTERTMVLSGLALYAQILQLGHHGSRTSTSSDFLEMIAPEVAVYSAGAQNIYGHPHPEIVGRIMNAGIRLYGTDIHGSITFRTDGKGYEVTTMHHGELLGGAVDLNSASSLELQRIIHIGEKRAEEIIKLRKTRPFTSLDDLIRVPGLGKQRIADIKKQNLAFVKGGEEQYEESSD